MPHPVNVQFVCVDKGMISPVGAFSKFNPNDPFEELCYPQYVDYLDSSDLANTFSDDLRDLLHKNNVELISDSSAYKLVISTISIHESNNRQTYFDSCYMANKYVYYSDLDVNVYATLYKNGVEVGSWTGHKYSWEGVRSKTDGCNKPKIRSILCGSDCMLNDAAKDLRVAIANKIYELEGF